MSGYHGKLLELLGLEENSGHYFLHVRASFENNIELSWEIDEYTAKNLKTIANFDEKYKYRLSFDSYWDTKQEHYVSILAQTYLEQSEKIHFLCSQNYVNGLLSLKHSQTILDLDRQYLKPINIENPHPQENMKYKNNVNFSLVPVTSLCIIFLIFFSYFDSVYLNKIGLNDQLFVHAVSSSSTPTIDDGFAKDHTYTQYSAPVTNTNLEPSHPIIYDVPVGNIALTFEGGPSKHSIEIMNVLNKYKVGGTFFFTGANVKKYPHHVKNIYTNGYSIGNHGMNHFSLPILSYEQQESELVESKELIESVINDKVVLFRPPYGAFNEDTEALINKYQYKMILWNNDPEDWKTHDTAKILNHIKHSNVSGSIIILHETQAVLNALPSIIEYLQELDLQIISLK